MTPFALEKSPPCTTFRIVREEEGVEKDSLPLSREQAIDALDALCDYYDPPTRANFLQEEDS